MADTQDDDRPIIGRDERERAHDTAELREQPGGTPGEQGNEDATNRQDTQATADDESLDVDAGDAE
jgi:hypothetical protein